VDRYKKKNVMLCGAAITLAFFLAALVLFLSSPSSAFASVSSPVLWLFAVLLLGGVIAGNIINIAIPTLVTHLVDKRMHDRANGMLGTVMGFSFAMTSVASGLVLGFLGMFWVLIFAIALIVVAAAYLSTIKIPE